MASLIDTTQKPPDCGCNQIPEFRRLKYFFGQMLGAQDLQSEQDYFREKSKLHNRCLHGYGTVCGLLVEHVPFPEDCFKEEEEEERRLREELERLLEARVAAQQSVAQGAGAADGAASGTDALDADIERVRRQLEDLRCKVKHEAPLTCLRIETGIARDCC